MIKLIATDMDGTLLDDQKRLPAAFPQLLSLLEERQIAFAVASGRSYPALQILFGEKTDSLFLICDNGAHVRIPGQEPVYQYLPFSVVHAVLDLCQQLPNVVPVLCGVEGIYYPISARESFQKEISNFYVQFSALEYPALYKLTDPIIKIAFCAMDGASQTLYTALHAQFGAEYELVISGAVWMDLMCKHVSKGMALARLQERLQITPEETAAFGDYQNDVSMFTQAYYSYAMGQASAEVKAQARFVAPPNTENGVVRTIYRLLQLSE
jgi:Cof subfamily protein (haloacid dehalogenase superfamily)